MRPPRSGAGLWAAAAAAALAGCDPGPPNVVLISVDTLRADHVGCYGYARATSPNLDGLAERGAVFDDTLSVANWTLPSHASMFTGTYPPRHGLQDDGVELAAGAPTLARALAEQGYQTLAVVSHVYVSSAFGLQRGFEVFDDSLIDRGRRNPAAEEVVRRAAGLLDGVDTRRPVFVFVHFFDPHFDYRPPPPFDTRFTDPGYEGDMDGSYARMLQYQATDRQMPEADRQHVMALYDGEIAYVDSQIGALLDDLDARGLLEGAIVAVVGDHGEEFEEHGRLGHGWSLYEEQLRVPLIVAGHPGLPPGTRRSEPVSLVDLAPTLLAGAGVAVPPGMEGRDLGAPGAGARVVFSESLRFGYDMRAARLGSLKLIDEPHTGARRFFELASDPGEQRPLDQDPSGGVLTDSFTEHVARADNGWHLKLLALRGAALRCRGIVESDARLVRARHYFSRNLTGRSAQIASFELGAQRRSLSFDVRVANHAGEIVFETDPPGASIALRLQAVGGGEPGCPVFLGAGQPLDPDQASLVPGDERLTGIPDAYGEAAPGLYLRAVTAPRGAPVELSDEAKERLRALGYVQ